MTKAAGDLWSVERNEVVASCLKVGNLGTEENCERETSQRRFNVWNGDVQQEDISLLPMYIQLCVIYREKELFRFFALSNLLSMAPSYIPSSRQFEGTT